MGQAVLQQGLLGEKTHVGFVVGRAVTPGPDHLGSGGRCRRGKEPLRASLQTHVM